MQYFYTKKKIKLNLKINKKKIIKKASLIYLKYTKKNPLIRVITKKTKKKKNKPFNNIN